MARISKVWFKRCIHSCPKSRHVQSGYWQQDSSTASTPLPCEKFLCNPRIKNYKTDMWIQHLLIVNNKEILWSTYDFVIYQAKNKFTCSWDGCTCSFLYKVLNLGRILGTTTCKASSVLFLRVDWCFDFVFIIAENTALCKSVIWNAELW